MSSADPQPVDAPVAGDETTKGADFSKLNSSIDIVIVMDCTGSMGSWIEAAKSTSLSTVQRLRQAAPNAKFRLGFVGYRDHGDSDAIITVPLTDDVAACEARLRSVGADGGGDTCEDMAGGLHAAVNLDWHDAAFTAGRDTRIVIVVADAPPHGADMHDVMYDDNWPRVDPAGRSSSTLRQLVRDLAGKSVDMYFMKINSSTDVCIREMNAAFTAGRASEEQSFAVLNLTAQSGGGPAPAPVYHSHPVAPGMPPMPYPTPMPVAYEHASVEDACAELSLESAMLEPIAAGADSGAALGEERDESRSKRSEAMPSMARRIAAPPSASMMAAPMAFASAPSAPSGVSDGYSDAVFSSVLRSAARRMG